MCAFHHSQWGQKHETYSQISSASVLNIKDSLHTPTTLSITNLPQYLLKRTLPSLLHQQLLKKWWKTKWVGWSSEPTCKEECLGLCKSSNSPKQPSEFAGPYGTGAKEKKWWCHVSACLPNKELFFLTYVCVGGGSPLCTAPVIQAPCIKLWD